MNQGEHQESEVNTKEMGIICFYMTTLEWVSFCIKVWNVVSVTSDSQILSQPFNKSFFFLLWNFVTDISVGAWHYVCPVPLFQLRLDVAELSQLQEQASRPKVKDILGLELRKLQTELARKLEEQAAAADGVKIAGEQGVGGAPTPKPKVSGRPVKDVKNYGESSISSVVSSRADSALHRK